MKSWRDSILDEFVPHVSRLTLVADPDSLLGEEKLVLELRSRGFDLIEFDDPVGFRYAYESQYRSIWDRGEHTDLVVVLRLQGAELESLPYDLLQAGRTLSFNLGDLFPNLSYPVVEKLDRGSLDALFDAQKKSPPDRMGDNATRDYMLRHVFGVAAELITTDVELLRSLLRIHYGNIQIPLNLATRLVQVLRNQSAFEKWPLEEIVPDESAFYGFLQERWPLFLHTVDKSSLVHEETSEYGLKYAGPATLPFDHQDIKVYIDNLFVEGKLVPVQLENFSVDAGSWIRSGIVEERGEDDELRISKLFQLVEEKLPTEDARFSDWTSFASIWAELSALVHSGDGKEHNSPLWELGERINALFATWLREHYAGLLNLPPTNPAMVHHVPRRLAREVEKSKDTRVALVVVDGLSLEQWVTVRKQLQQQDPTLVMRDSSTFAWIPTVTSVSRQSIFSGKPPLYFPSTIGTTNSEGSLWRQFWEGNGLSKFDIAYQRGLGDGDPVKILDAEIHPGKTRVVGLVVDKVDKIMHGMQLGSAGMQNQIIQWCKGGYLTTLVGRLLDIGFEVWLTSDHGNIECEGTGKPSEGVIAETRGERMRVYPTPELRSQVAKEFESSTEWEPIGLPPSYYPLLAVSRTCFMQNGKSAVAHGGMSIEEVIVPLVSIKRQSK